MPRRYPLGIQTFSEIIEGDYYYVDKTADIHRMTSTYKYGLCLYRRWPPISVVRRTCSKVWPWSGWRGSGRSIR